MRIFILILFLCIQKTNAIEAMFSNVGPDLLATVHFKSDSCFTSSHFIYEMSKDKEAFTVEVYKGYFTEQKTEMFSKVKTLYLTEEQVKGLDKLLKYYRELPLSGSTSMNTIKIEWNRPFMSGGKRIGISTPLVETMFVDQHTEEQQSDLFSFSDVANAAETQKEK